jgi:ATP-binding cassette subfamily C protein LapB
LARKDSTEGEEKRAKGKKSGKASLPREAFKTTSSKADDSGLPSQWPLQADRIGISMPLLDVLVIMAGHYGRRTSVDMLTAGLPISKDGVTPLLFTRAAERADLHARLMERSLKSLKNAPNLPCVLVLKEGQACVLWEINSKGFVVQFPETREEKQVMKPADLNALYSGYAFFVRPVARVDDRAGPALIDTGRDWFWSVFKENKVIYIEVVAAAIMINLFGLVSSLFVMTVYDRVVPNNAIETLWTLTVGIMVVYIFDFILKNLRSWFLDYAGRKADVKISASLFEQILGMTMAARPASAGVLASKMREFEGIRDFFTSATLVTLIDLPFVLLYIAVIAIIGGPLAFVPLVAIPLVLVVGWMLQKPLQKVIAESLHENALKNALLFETFTGLETVKVQAAEGHMQRSWEEISDEASRTSVRIRKLSSFAQNWAMFIQQMVSVWIVVFGVFMIAGAHLSMGGLIACVILSGRAMGPLAQVAGLLTRMSQSKQSLDHLDEMMRAPVERPKDKHFISKSHVEGRIEFRDVVFRYPNQSIPALNGMNFIIKPGERVGVIGAVGSGKTTIERLLLNLYPPESGSVQVDGTDVRQIEPGDLRRNVGAVQQSPQIFYGSVRQNITMGHETASEQAVIRAAEMAGVMEFLADSEAGLDTPVGERGEALSGGQRQAIAIARALLYDPPILVLDEPTAAMDPASESRLRKRLEVLCEGKTTILITHKGSMLPLVDKLILLDRGKLIAYGPRDEVIKKLQARQYGTAAENTKV